MLVRGRRAALLHCVSELNKEGKINVDKIEEEEAAAKKQPIKTKAMISTILMQFVLHFAFHSRSLYYSQ